MEPGLILPLDGLRSLGDGAFGTTLQTVLVGLVASWIALVLHELGHAVAAWLVGVRIWGIQLGMGPTLWRGMVGETRVHFAIFPLLGAVHLLDEDASTIGYRDIARGRWRFQWGPHAWRAPIISAAGGLSNLAGLVMTTLAWSGAGAPWFGSVGGDLFLFTIVANLAGYLNLLPWFRSDGIHLLAHMRAARLAPATVSAG
ncbi:MAG TPA: site-2 protease family protein [Gemmatimonadales bacterium]|nr:site-2 protease family protein [Gemmatimonadales bacterium]